MLNINCEYPNINVVAILKMRQVVLMLMMVRYQALFPGHPGERSQPGHIQRSSKTFLSHKTFVVGETFVGERFNIGTVINTGRPREGSASLTKFMAANVFHLL
jgi:hypothetical protein